MNKTPSTTGSGIANEDAIVQAWNAIDGVTHVRNLTNARRRALRARLADPDFGENWGLAIDRVSKSPFCRGANDRHWRATFDWFIRPDTLTKILEGTYDDHEPPKPKMLSVAEEIARRFAITGGKRM